MRNISGFLVLPCLLFITGCQPDAFAGASPTFPISTSLPAENNEGDEMYDPVINPDLQAQKMIQLAKLSLAGKLKISENKIHLAEMVAMAWPDTSLGCPQEGIVYAQVVTPGFQILLETMGQTFSYHTDDSERVVLCDIRPPHEIFLPP
ncbi:MAG: hypothetical protein K8S20_06330 [Chloroflexi bacterium]|nr:hypothetical protein [Chloroflexota bacterium]